MKLNTVKWIYWCQLKQSIIKINSSIKKFVKLNPYKKEFIQKGRILIEHKFPDKKGTDKQKTVILLKNVNQATKRNTEEEIEKEDKPTKYTYKNYAGFLVVILIFLFFVGLKFYSFFNNFFFSTINLSCSFSGNVVKFPC